MKRGSVLGWLIAFSMRNRAVVFIAAAVLGLWGVSVAPFDFSGALLHLKPVSVDAIPNIGENQQIVFTAWPGAAPSDVEEQITYPLSQTLMGLPGVKTVRAASMFGFSTVYVIFDDDTGFYWARARLLEKLAALPQDLLPPGVTPTLGPPGTALGQVFWYTIEGRDKKGRPTGGWDLAELRRVQDTLIRYRLASVEGVAEVASIGGFVREFHVEVDPDALRRFGISLDEVAAAVGRANRDVGARTLEINKVEYVIRGVGRAHTLEEFRGAVLRSVKGIPVTVGQVARVTEGPALRRGLLDKEGAEAVGGVVTVNEGANTMVTVKRIKERIKELGRGMPSKVLPDGRLSTLTIVPFYDRSVLIGETVKTLEHTLRDEILVTLIVILVMLGHLRSSIIVGSMLPLAVLVTFVVMKNLHMEANSLALSGIGIAIGTMVDMGIVILENIVRHLEARPSAEAPFVTIHRAATEVASAVVTSVATTVVSFIPVFAMTATEGKLFKPLAYTKTFALMSSLILALFLIPPLALTFMGDRGRLRRWLITAASLILSVVLTVRLNVVLGGLVLGVTLYGLFAPLVPRRAGQILRWIVNVLLAAAALWVLSSTWRPLGHARSAMDNFLLTALLLGSVLSIFVLFHRLYVPLLRWCLNHRIQFLSLMGFFLVFGFVVWRGFAPVTAVLPSAVTDSAPGRKLSRAFPGLQRQFMPDLDEGTFLFMPTVMPHASIGEAQKIMRLQDMAIRSIPEVQTVVGKLGRADTALDPAPISMFETIITYRDEYLRGPSGALLLFAHDGSGSDLVRDAAGNPLRAPDGLPYRASGRFLRDSHGALVPDPGGRPFRLWRPALIPALNEGRRAWPGIRSPDDIWRRITDRARVPGSTSAPRLQPISTRIVMLQTGVRAAMALKVLGADPSVVEHAGIRLERFLRTLPAVDPATVSAERTVGKPYLNIVPRAEALQRYGLSRGGLMSFVELAVGGRRVTTVIRGRERIPVRVRFLSDYRDTPAALGALAVSVGGGRTVSLGQLADINYQRGPQTIKSEESFVTAAVTFDGKPGYSKVRVMEEVLAAVDGASKSGRLDLPRSVTLRPAGSYEDHLRASRTLMVIIPLALALIFLLIHLQFGSVAVTLIIFSGVAVAWAGGFIMLWLYGRPWFLDVSIMGVGLRDLFHVGPVNLSVAVWVGFLALFGIATDDGVVMATHLVHRFEKAPKTLAGIRERTIEAGKTRVRACLMTTATTLLALIPVLTSTGRGADVMGPMAVPLFGGMALELFTMLVVPVLFSLVWELRLRASTLRAPAWIRRFSSLRSAR